eukprot:SAG31_NODE_14570_length_798_cov_69.650930_1_plen_78_part_00
MRVQAMSVGFIVTAMLSPFIVGYIRSEVQFAIKLIDWVMLAVSVIIGSILGSLAVAHEGPVNIGSTVVVRLAQKPQC